MEDILDVYKLPHDPKKPLICMDENSKQQVKEVRTPLPVKEGQPVRYDNEYERNGVSNLFMFFAPLDEPEEARRIARKLEIHYTPKHGSWLNMAEIELSILSRQCLDRRIPVQDTLKAEVAAWEAIRNRHREKMEWRFTTKDARIKLKKLYPSISLK